MQKSSENVLFNLSKKCLFYFIYLFRSFGKSPIWSHAELLVFLTKCCHIETLLRHICTLFRHIQHPVKPSLIHNLTIFCAQVYFEWEAYLKPCHQAYSEPCHRALFSHIQTYSELCATLAYAETWHTQNPGIFRTLP